MHSSAMMVGFLLALLGVSTAWGASTQDCLGCHGDNSIEGRGGGKPYIDADAFASTTHASLGCTACHDTQLPGHPDDGQRPSLPHCQDCHDATAKEYAKSFHAQNAVCADCHNPHQVKSPVAISGDEINAPCAKCHETSVMMKTHEKWLPQTLSHLKALPCIACHTGSEDYVITMFIQKMDPGGGKRLTATHPELAQSFGSESLSKLADTNGNGLITLDELVKFNQTVQSKGLRLWGMMMPQVMTHTYQILRNRWDCSFCHASGPDARQTSFVAFPRTDGKLDRIEVQKGAVMDLLYGTPDFYMVGATRNLWLSLLGGAIILAGIGFASVHGFFRYLTRKNREALPSLGTEEETDL